MLRTFVIPAALAAALLIAGQAAVAAVDATDLLMKALIEKRLLTEDEAAAVRAEIATTRADEEAARKAFPATGKRPVTLSGYTQIRYLNADGAGAPSTLEARRVRLTLAGDATPDLEYRAQVDFAGARRAVTNAAFATALVGRPVLLDAAIGYRFPGGHKLTVGQQKVPFGQENLASSNNFALINYAQVSDNLVPSRDIGAQGYDTGILFTGARALRAASLEYA
ncbi:MAG TPA: porin, partial [Armatimonadota bacterium]|nr:porin [Armatimonadota bacterium]